MSDRLVTVATFHDPLQASMVKNYLDEQGIPSVLMDESTVATDWMLSTAIGGIKLQVAPIHVERAEMLLVQVEAEKDAEEPLPPETAIASQEIAEELQAEREDRSPINQLVDRIFRAAVFGLIFWPLQVYVFCLLAQLTGEPGKISDNRRWKVGAAVVLSAGTAVAVMMFLYTLVTAET